MPRVADGQHGRAEQQRDAGPKPAREPGRDRARTPSSPRRSAAARGPRAQQREPEAVARSRRAPAGSASSPGSPRTWRSRSAPRPRSSRARRAARVTRRSTSGERVRSSKRPHRPNTTAAAPSSARRGGRPPHSVPFEIASSRQTSATAEPDRARQVEAAAGAHRRLGDHSAAPQRPAAHRAPPRPAKSQRQLACSATMPVSGRPIAPPMPSDELISAIPLPTRSGGQHVAHDADARAGSRRARRPAAPGRRSAAPTSGATAPSAEPTVTSAERHEQHPALAVHVAEPAQHRRADGARHQGGGDQPGDRRRRSAEQLREAGEERDDQGLHQRDGQAARRQDRDDERGAGSHRFR